MITLDTKVIKENTVGPMRQVEDIGKNQYNDFKLTIVSHDDNSFHDPLSKINLAIFRSKGLQKSSKNKDRLKTMKTDIDLFSNMYIACQHRDGDLDNFFAHKNHTWHFSWLFAHNF